MRKCVVLAHASIRFKSRPGAAVFFFKVNTHTNNNLCIDFCAASIIFRRGFRYARCGYQRKGAPFQQRSPTGR